MILTKRMVRPIGFEPMTYRLEVCRSIQLSYGRIFQIIFYFTGIEQKFKLNALVLQQKQD